MSFDYPLGGQVQRRERHVRAFGIGHPARHRRVRPVIDALRRGPADARAASSACTRRMTAACRCSWTTRIPPTRLEKALALHHGAHARPHHLRVRLRRRPRRVQAPHHGPRRARGRLMPWSRPTTPAPRTPMPSSPTSWRAWAQGEGALRRAARPPRAPSRDAIELCRTRRFHPGGRQGP